MRPYEYHIVTDRGSSYYYDDEGMRQGLEQFQDNPYVTSVRVFKVIAVYERGEDSDEATDQ